MPRPKSTPSSESFDRARPPASPRRPAARPRAQRRPGAAAVGRAAIPPPFAVPAAPGAAWARGGPSSRELYGSGGAPPAHVARNSPYAGFTRFTAQSVGCRLPPLRVSPPNVLAGRFVVPKFLQEHATAANFAPAAQPRLELDWSGGHGTMRT